MCVTWRSCCCCISLEVGTQVIGVVSIVGNILAIVSLLFDVSYTYFHDDSDRSLGSADVIVYSFILLLGATQLIFAVMMTRGAFQKRPSLMWPWIITAWVCGVTTFGLQMALLAYHLKSQVHAHKISPIDVLYIVLYFLNSVTVIYFSCVVNSRRKQMVVEYYASPVRFSRSDSYERRLYVPVTTYEYKA